MVGFAKIHPRGKDTAILLALYAQNGTHTGNLVALYQLAAICVAPHDTLDQKGWGSWSPSLKRLREAGCVKKIGKVVSLTDQGWERAQSNLLYHKDGVEIAMQEILKAGMASREARSKILENQLKTLQSLHDENDMLRSRLIDIEATLRHHDRELTNIQTALIGFWEGFSQVIEGQRGTIAVTMQALRQSNGSQD